MKRADMSMVADHLNRKAAFMVRQARDVSQLSGTPGELADNQDRASILRQKAELFRHAATILAPRVSAHTRTADHGGAGLENTQAEGSRNES